uniref:Protein phosphatase 2c n=1 Tax=Nyssomyia neivai TaxID=330878 RepID=A0A1L8DL16_9DIPT
MGSFLDKPKTDKYNEHGEGNGLRFGVGSMQGWRCEMEDAHYAKAGLGGRLEEWSFFAVFDGHAGFKVSEHCAKHLLECITQTDEFKQDDVVKGIHTGFLKLDEMMRDLPELASGADKSGTTAVCTFISPDDIFIANCGDSRAVLCRNGVPIFTTQDHKPVLPGERERIQNAGGSVVIQRVNGSLAVSRALGDYEYKNVKDLGQCEQLVSPEPEIFHHSRDQADNFLVLACDGVWDVMNNDDVCSFIHSRLQITNNLEEVANQVIDTCLHKGSRDNMSIIIIVFPGGPSPSQEAIQAETELEAQLEKAIKEIIDSTPGLDYENLLQRLYDEHIPGLPPGGGLVSKCRFIAKIFKQHYPHLAEVTCEVGCM